MTPPLDEFECRMMVVLTLDVGFYVFLLKEGRGRRRRGRRRIDVTVHDAVMYDMGYLEFVPPSSSEGP